MRRVSELATRENGYERKPEEEGEEGAGEALPLECFCGMFFAGVEARNGSEWMLSLRSSGGGSSERRSGICDMVVDWTEVEVEGGRQIVVLGRD
jgi:hypothetical protein